jgi:hypothetical protein
MRRRLAVAVLLTALLVGAAAPASAAEITGNLDLGELTAKVARLGVTYKTTPAVVVTPSPGPVIVAPAPPGGFLSGLLAGLLRG